MVNDAHETMDVSSRYHEAGGVYRSLFSVWLAITLKRRVPVSICVILSVALIAWLLALLSNRMGIAPMIESDYAYQLVAADRFLVGDGFTTLQPIAPGQPWNFQYEWGFLTKWPVGYSMLVATVRHTLSCTSVQACRMIGIVACALAIVGWFMWSRRIASTGLRSVLLSVAALGVGLTAEYLINPSTDLLLAAAIPYLLLLTHHALAGKVNKKHSASIRVKSLALVGLLSGGLFWLRYASVFIPAGIGGYLIWNWLNVSAFSVFLRRLIRGVRVTKSVETARAKARGSVGKIPTPTTYSANVNTMAVSGRDIVIFGLCACLPIAALLLINQSLGSTESMQAQVNLGHRVGFNLSLSLIWQAWWQFTDLGYYNHHAIVHWMIALYPGCLLAIALFVPTWRQGMVTFLTQRAVTLSACLLFTFLMMIVLATALFGDKFDFAGLERYYIPLRPIYFLLFVAPLIAIRSRIMHLGLCLVLLMCCSWTFQQQWQRNFERWAQADRVTSPYGVWSRCFEPHSNQLFSHLRNIADDRLILVSNFHEYLALETSLPTLPIPSDRASLDRWVNTISTIRNIAHPHVIFVLDPNNQWRNYWIPNESEIAITFALSPDSFAFADSGASVYQYHTNSPS